MTTTKLYFVELRTQTYADSPEEALAIFIEAIRTKTMCGYAEVHHEDQAGVLEGPLEELADKA